MRNEDRTIILGPCPCRGCGESVYWDGWGWRNVLRNAEHFCHRTRHRPNRMLANGMAEWSRRGAA